MTSNGTPRVTMGNGDGFTTLILTDKESRLIREALTYAEVEVRGCEAAYNAGIQRATARIAEEFAQEQKRRKEK